MRWPIQRRVPRICGIDGVSKNGWKTRPAAGYSLAKTFKTVNIEYLEDGQAALLLALVAAGSAGQREEVPVGAVLRDAAGRFLGECGNNRIAAMDPTGHAEMRLLRLSAARVGHDRLTNTALAVTLEPCPMCLAALSMARVGHLLYEAESLLAPLPLPAGLSGSVPLSSHQPASNGGSDKNIEDENQTVNAFSSLQSSKPDADAGELLRIFFDKRRQT